MLRSGLHSLPLGLNAHMATSQHTYLDPSVKRALEALDATFASPTATAAGSGRDQPKGCGVMVNIAEENQDGIPGSVESSGSALRTRDAVRSGLSDLLERVEAATGADRELDALLCAYFRVLSPAAEKERWAREWGGPIVAHEGRVYLAHDDGRRGLNCDARPVTASLDAALALVERVLPDFWWLVRSDEAQGFYGNMGRNGTSGNRGDPVWPAYAATPALALLAALLKALIAQEASDAR